MIRGELSLSAILLSLTGQKRSEKYISNQEQGIVQEGQVNSFLLPNKSVPFCSLLSPLKEQCHDFLAQSNPANTDNNFLW